MELIVFFLLIGYGLFAEKSDFLLMDLCFELVHGFIVDLELIFEFEDLLLNLWVGFEVSLILFGLEELLDFLVEGGDLMFKFLVLFEEVEVDFFEFFGGEIFESFFDLFAFDDTGLGRGTELGLVGEESALHGWQVLYFIFIHLA
jgi:hypothetical protein